MSASLDAAKTKVQRAEKHFGDFKDIVFGRSTGVDARKTTVLHYDLQPQSNAGPTALLAPPRECRLAFGDAVHQLRASLDHVVYALAQPYADDRKVLRKIDFPIYIDENLLNSSKGVNHLRRLCQSSLEMSPVFTRYECPRFEVWLHAFPRATVLPKR